MATSAASSQPGSAAGRPPTEQARKVAVATVLAACGKGRLDLAEAEDLVSRVYGAPTAGDLQRAIAGLPHPPAPLVMPGDT